MEMKCDKVDLCIQQQAAYLQARCAGRESQVQHPWARRFQHLLNDACRLHAKRQNVYNV